jgi:hypothetical protein
VKDSATNSSAYGLSDQDISHHHTTRKRIPLDQQQDELPQPEPKQQPLPLQKIERLAVELRSLFVQLREADPLAAATARRLILGAVKEAPKEAPKKIGRPQDSDTARAVELYDQGFPWKHIPREVLDEHRQTQSDERCYLLRKAKAVVKRREHKYRINKQKVLHELRD